MNILLYSHSFLPKIGGRELVVYQLARALHDLGHEVRVLGPRLRRGEPLHGLGVRVHRYPGLTPGRLRSGGRRARSAALREHEMLLQLVLDVKWFGADVIHAHTTWPAGYVAARARRWLPGVPLVITPHGIDINLIPGFGMRHDEDLRGRIDQALLAADAVTAISLGIARSVIDAGGDPRKLYEVSNGTDLERFARPPAPDLRQRFGLKPGDRIVLTVGNYHPRKGMEDLIKALPAIRDGEPRTKLVIAGGGTDVLRPVAEAAGVGAHVILTGRLPVPIDAGRSPGDDPLASLYGECAVYVSASNNPEAEGLSLAILDAMAAGKAAVATRISGNEDVVAHGVSGFLVPPGDRAQLAARTLELLRDPRLASRMGEEGRRRAARLSWPSIARQYLHVYELARAARGAGAAVERV